MPSPSPPPSMAGRPPVPTDPSGLRGDAPLLDAWLRFHEESPTPFTIPGHKQRRDLVGDVVAGDVPLYAGLDTMKLTGGVLVDAEQRAARLWGAELCRFSVGGSTHGNQALALAVGGPGDRVVVARTLHRSMLIGLVLAGLVPVWVRPEVDPRHGLPVGVSPSALEVTLRSAPDVRAVFVGDPSYVGTVGDVAGLAAVAHRYDVPLVVDAAWGAHLGFHPGASRTRPRGGCRRSRHQRPQGAPGLVAGGSRARVRPRGSAVAASRPPSRRPRRRARRAPSWPVSTRPVRCSSVTGPRCWVPSSRPSPRSVGGWPRCPAFSSSTAPPSTRPGSWSCSPCTGADGNAVEADLLAAGMPVEMADRDTVVAMVTLADTPGRIEDLAVALAESIDHNRGPARPVITSGVWAVEPVCVLTPREAFFAPRESLPVERAVGRVSAELIAPYPPGIPVLAPGEEVTLDALDALRAARTAGSRIAYAADPHPPHDRRRGDLTRAPCPIGETRAPVRGMAGGVEVDRLREGHKDVSHRPGESRRNASPPCRSSRPALARTSLPRSQPRSRRRLRTAWVTTSSSATSGTSRSTSSTARTADIYAGAARSHLELALHRLPGVANVRVYNPSTENDGWSNARTIIQIVTDDMPFLVDSVTGALVSAGIDIHLIVHPQLVVTRDAVGRLDKVLDQDVTGRSATGGVGELAESWMLLSIDRESDEERRAGIERQVREVLEDVRQAVEDWPKMRSKCLVLAAEIEGTPPPGIDPDEVALATRFLRWMADDHFTFLGFRDYTLSETPDGEIIAPVTGSGLGMLRLRPAARQGARRADPAGAGEGARARTSSSSPRRTPARRSTGSPTWTTSA